MTGPPKSQPPLDEKIQLKKPTDKAGPKVDENVQLDDETNFVELDSEEALDLDEMNNNIDGLMNDNPENFAKELEEIRSSSNIHHKMKHHAKAKTHTK